MGRIGPKHNQSYTAHPHLVIRVNPWIELVQSTTKAILHISSDLEGHFLKVRDLLE